MKITLENDKANCTIAVLCNSSWANHEGSLLFDPLLRNLSR